MSFLRVENMWIFGTKKWTADAQNCRITARINKTDKSKRKGVCFGGKVLTDKKSAQFLFRSIFNPTHHSLLFCLDFLADRSALVRKRCGGKLGWSDLSIPHQKLRVKYYNTLTKAGVRANRDRKITKKSFRPS
jgi:hypothetical protein